MPRPAGIVEPYFSETPGFFAVILIHSAYSTTTCSQMFQHALQSGLVLLLYVITTSLYALHYISGFFIIMSPAEGLHFSALVCLFVCL